MSAHDDRLRDRQFAFAAHLRDAANPPPPGIEPRRMAVYRELFRATLESLLAANFPVIRRTLGGDAWMTLVGDFHREHRCATPLFTEIAPEFIAWLKTQGDKVSYASSGSGTSIHMAGELFKVRTGLKTQHVPYKGSAPALADLMGGQVQFMFDNMPAAWPQVQAGKLRALAVTTKKRSPTAPDLPTMEESGVAPFDVTSWFGMVAPKGTPKDVIDKVNKAMNAAFDKPEVKAAYAKLGAVAEHTTPAQFSQFIKSEVSNWAPVVKASGAKVD